MTEPAEKLEPQPSSVRRFNLAEMSEQLPWILPRLLKAYPNQNQRSIIGWLNTVIDQNEFLCLYQPHAVCFAERVALDRLSGKMIVREIFVWCEDPENISHVHAAAEFYPMLADWARHQGIDKVIVCEKTDVPAEEVRKKFTRLHEIKTMFARV
jgi:hypothetical protein